MTHIIYRIEPKSEQAFLLHITEEGKQKKQLYLADLLSNTSPKDKAPLQFLSYLKLQDAKSKGLGQSLETIALNQVEIPAKKAHDFLALLTKEHKVFFQKTAVRVDFSQKAEFYFHVRESVKGAEVEGRLNAFGKDFALQDCSFIFHSTSPLYLHEGILGKIEGAPFKWLEKLKTGTSFVNNLERFLDDFQEGPRIAIAKEKKEIAITPILILKDPSFSFADLWFDYGVGKIAFHDLADSISGIPRNKEVERSFAKDLQETGFKEKSMTTSKYYCPTDTAAETVQFLLELGWIVQDFQRREIVALGDLSLQIFEHENHAILEGELAFGVEKIKLSEAFAHYKGKSSLLPIGQNKAALLDRRIIEKKLGAPLPPFTLKKSEWRELAPLLAAKNASWDEKVLSIARNLADFSSLNIAPPGEAFQAKLFSYQQEGVNWLHFIYENGFGGLLADEMGLGKTVQVLAFFSRLRTFLPILIVCPSSLVYHWRAEMQKFLQAEPYLHLGPQRTKDREELQKQTYLITSYALLRIDAALFSSLSFACIVLDESSYIKNDQSLTAETAFRLKAQSKIALNGTPIENRMDELWSQFHFLNPHLLGDKKTFLEMSPEALKKKIKPFLLKRKKEEVEIQLPPRIEQDVWVEMQEEERRLYDEFLQDARVLLENKEEASQMEILEKILRLRQICCHPALVKNITALSEGMGSAKLEQFLLDLDQVVLQKSKALIYSQFTEMLQLIRQKLPSCLYLDGSTPAKERIQIVQAFQEDPEEKILLISLKAGGVGLNLTAADYVFLYDPWWNEAVERQAISRAHRLGRTKTVIAKRYLTLNTIEAKIADLAKEKEKLAQSIDSNQSHLTKEDLLHLLR